MIVLGLTGSIGMGKSTAAAMLRRLGVPVHDADAAVHRLLGPRGAAIAAVEAAFPGVSGPSGVDRRKLGAIVFPDATALRRLEAILHPLVRQDERRFLAHMARRRAPLVVLDIPLLFESGAERRCDAVIVVTAPPFLQRARVLRRPGMSEARFRAVIAKQMPDAEKRRRADFVVDTAQGKLATLRMLASIIRRMREKVARRAGACSPGERSGLAHGRGVHRRAARRRS
jgi:dephospho-CoA kinase